MNAAANSDPLQGPITRFDYSPQYANNSPVHVGRFEDKVWLR